jgi:hypothetical protein
LRELAVELEDCARERAAAHDQFSGDAHLHLWLSAAEPAAGAPQPVDVPRDDGSKQRIYRCPTCQVAVFSEYGRPEVRFVRGGTLDDPSGVTPDVHIFTRSKLSWVTLSDSVPAFEVYYDSRALWPAASIERLDAIFAPAASDA